MRRCADVCAMCAGCRLLSLFEVVIHFTQVRQMNHDILGSRVSERRGKEGIPMCA